MEVILFCLSILFLSHVSCALLTDHTLSRAQRKCLENQGGHVGGAYSALLKPLDEYGISPHWGLTFHSGSGHGAVGRAWVYETRFPVFDSRRIMLVS